jgi:hypothetical protein
MFPHPILVRNPIWIQQIIQRMWLWLSSTIQIYFSQFVYSVHLHIVGNIQFYQTFMGTQNKYGILYGGKI